MNRLKELRKQRKLTQDDLVLQLNKKYKNTKSFKPFSKMTVSNWENNKHDIKQEKAEILADFFEVNTAYLLGLSEDVNDLARYAEKLTNEIKDMFDFFYNKGYILSDESFDLIRKTLGVLSSADRKLLDSLSNNNSEDEKYIAKRYQYSLLSEQTDYFDQLKQNR